MHIFRLVSEATIEENILLKARQKRQLAHMSLEEGQFTTAALFSAVSVRDLVDSGSSDVGDNERLASAVSVADADFMRALAAVEDDDDRAASKAATAEARAEMAEFDELPSVPQLAAGAIARGSTPAVTPGCAEDGDAEGNEPRVGATADKSRRDKKGTATTHEIGDDEAPAGLEPPDDASSSDSSDGTSSSDEDDCAIKTVDDVAAAEASDESRSETESGGASPGRQAMGSKRVRFDDNGPRAHAPPSLKARAARGRSSATEGQGPKPPRGAVAAKGSSALDRIDLDALALETTAAEEGLEDALSERAAASAPSQGYAAGGAARQPSKQPSAQALFDAVTTGIGSGSTTIVNQQRDRVAIAMSKFALVEASLQPTERYAFRYRESRDPHPWVAPEVLREVEASFAVEERAWELEQLQAVADDEEREAEADAELLQLSGGGSAAGAAAGAELYVRTLRELRHGINVRAATGAAWEERLDEARQEKFFFNVDTKEAVWEKPLVLRARDATLRARREGYAGLHHLPAVALRVMRFLEPAPDRLHRVAFVCRSWRALAEHPALFKFVRQSGGSGGASDSAPATLDPFVSPSVVDDIGSSTAVEKPAARRMFDSISSALAFAVPGDTIVVASGSHYVPHPLEVACPVRLVSQVSLVYCVVSCRPQFVTFTCTVQGVRGCLFAGSVGIDVAADAEWLFGGGSWYPSLSYMPPSIARQLGLASGYLSDVGFAAIGASLSSELAVADSAVVRIDGPLVWRTSLPLRVASHGGRNTGNSIHTTGNASLDQQTARICELYSLTSGSVTEPPVAVRARVGGSGQLRGITLRNVRPILPHCLVVTGPGPVSVVSDSTVLPSSSLAPSQPCEVGATSVTFGASGSAAPSTLEATQSSPRRTSRSLDLASPLQVVQCDLGNRSGSGACVVANSGAALLLLACRISSGSGSGILVQVSVYLRLGLLRCHYPLRETPQGGSTAGVSHCTVQVRADIIFD